MRRTFQQASAEQLVAADDVLQVQVSSDGRTTGRVVVSKRNELILMNFTVAHGHLPATTRRSLVEQAFRLPELDRAGQQVLATIPLGDVELLQGLRARLSEVRARAAGATCLIEATTAEVSTAEATTD